MSDRNSSAKLERILAALSESLFMASDEEILEEVPEGEDPEALAQDVRDNLLGAVQTFKRRKLDAARATYEARQQEFAAAGPSLPTTPEERRSLLDTLMAQTPRLESALVTAQYRSLKEVPDDDVRSLLRQLQALGALEADDSDD